MRDWDRNEAMVGLLDRAANMCSCSFRTCALRLSAAGFSASEIKAAGYSISEVMQSGALTGMKAAGYALDDMRAVGFTETELRRAGFALCSEGGASRTSRW